MIGQPFKEAVLLVAQEMPNSSIGDLLAVLPESCVLQLVESFSGTCIKIPKVETIWRVYRNRIIKDTLDQKDTMVVRQKLAEYFGITRDTVNQVYNWEKRHHSHLLPSHVGNSVERVVASKHEEILKKFREALVIRRGRLKF